ncbi:hypothetical protein BKA69DRAFT_1107789 [Paraphysoderma sedebokerense]|nr:hypothetical protein BKA69DRAFT_1107789 [Paraphysoderma sedebokerense]
MFTGLLVHLMVNPLDPWVAANGQQPMQWFWTTYSVALYHILIERAIAVGRVNLRQSVIEQVMRYFVPFILAIPQLICVGLIHLPSNDWYMSQANFQTFRNATLAGAVISVFANAVLSFSFIRTLATHRSKGIIGYIVENKKESAGLVARLLVASGYVVIKIVGLILPVPAQPPLFSLFHNAFASIVTLNTFSDYILITKKVSKHVLASGFEVKNDSKKVSAAVKTVNTVTA